MYNLGKKVLKIDLKSAIDKVNKKQKNRFKDLYNRYKHIDLTSHNDEDKTRFEHFLEAFQKKFASINKAPSILSFNFFDHGFSASLWPFHHCIRSSLEKPNWNYLRNDVTDEWKRRRQSNPSCKWPDDNIFDNRKNGFEWNLFPDSIIGANDKDRFPFRINIPYNGDENQIFPPLDEKYMLPVVNEEWYAIPKPILHFKGY